MGKPTGFMEYPRELPLARPPAERVHDWHEFHEHADAAMLQKQGARCMDCGVPFCHTGALIEGMASGCPINNLIPEWNDLVYRGLWKDALERLHKTNNFPEFTGRVCPAPCEGSCVLGINEPPVTIKTIECAIVDQGFEEGWIVPEPPPTRTGKKVAVVGSGPAGLAAAAQLNRAGHRVTVFERADRIGGLLMYGIPNMKLDKSIVQRRVDLMAAEGVEFVDQLRGRQGLPGRRSCARSSTPSCCAAAPPSPNDFFARTEGRNLKGIHFAMEFLHANTKSLLDSRPRRRSLHLRQGQGRDRHRRRRHRHRLRRHVDAARLPQPGAVRDPAQAAAGAGARTIPWPQWPKVYKLDYGQEEAAAVFGDDPREYLIQTKKFVGDDHGHVKELHTVRVEWVKDNGRPIPREVPGSGAGVPGPARAARDGLSGSGKSAARSARRREGPRGPTPRRSTASSPRASRACSPPATCDAARAWSCGRSTRAAGPRGSATAG